MNKQELLKQADYTFQRGNRALAKKYLLDVLTAYPDEAAAWMLLARVYEEKERKIECYERVLKINPQNSEARFGLVRATSPSPTLPLNSVRQQENPWQVSNPSGSSLRSAIIVIVILFGLGSTTYAIARNNPESGMAKLIIPATPTAFMPVIADNLAAQTRAEVLTDFPQYAALVDLLLNFAVENAQNGMEGAPERPGAEIVPFAGAAEDAQKKLAMALPQPGSLSSITLDEQQVTSWLALGLEKNPDLPLSDVQVYLRDDKIQVWSMFTGSTNSTSALIVGSLSLDANGKPGIAIESVQIGQQRIPELIVTQAEEWLNQLLLKEIDEQVPGLAIMNINVSSGLITISGMR